MTLQSVTLSILLSHFGQLMLISLWLSGNIFHIASDGNFTLWSQNPLRIRPIAHLQLDPHFGSFRYLCNMHH